MQFIKTNINYGYFKKSFFGFQKSNKQLRRNANDNKGVNVFLCGSCGMRDWQIASNFSCFCSYCNKRVTLTEIYED